MTTLYIKTHKITGLKYFGKTTRTGKSFDNYCGSGLHWLRHLKKHGKNIDTIIFAQFEDDDEILVESAFKFSLDNNIVESKEWANLQPENGKDGGVPTEETKQKIRDKRKHQVITERTKEKLSISSSALWKTKEYRGKVHQAQCDTWTDEKRARTSERSKSNNANAKSIYIYYSNDNLMFECYSNFKQLCTHNNLPHNALYLSYHNILPIYVKPLDSGSIYRLKEKGWYQYKGWYAIRQD